MSCSPFIGEYLKLLFAPADRGWLFQFTASRARRVICRQEKNVGACGCRT